MIRKSGDRQAVVCCCGDHAWLLLTKGYITLIDPGDIHAATAYNWSAKTYSRGLVYARRGKGPPFALHTHLTGQRGVDHANGNPLDNRRRNLRVATVEQNMWNKRPNARSKSKFKGVDYHEGLWRARIRASGKRHELGYFQTEDEAGEAYARAAAKLHGSFAKV